MDAHVHACIVACLCESGTEAENSVNVRSKGFPNGIFHPCAIWDRGLARWERSRRAAVVGVTWKSPGNITLTVLVFGPESVSYERSRRETAAKFNHFVVRIFVEFKHGLLSSISRFPGYQNDSLSSISRIPGYQNGLLSSISRFTGYQKGSCSSISRFTGYQHGSFSISSRFPGHNNDWAFQHSFFFLRKTRRVSNVHTCKFHASK